MSKQLATLTGDDLGSLPQPYLEAGFGALETPAGRLPLRALDVTARIEGLLAQVTVTQTFVNVHARPLEATYIFPLPDRAAVTSFRMEVAGRVVEGQIKERGAARREYREAIKTGHRAAIAEEDRPGVFTMRVGNLMPGEVATVHLTLTGPLPYADGQATFRFPLVVAPRYIPGCPLPRQDVGSGTAHDTDAVPDASRISPPVLLPGFASPVQLSLKAEILDNGLSIGEVRSSLHAIEELQIGGVRTIRIEPGERLDRDFVLRLSLDPGELCTALTLQPDSPSAREGTFLLTLVPPAAVQSGGRPRDVVFVLDRSGSMGGWKMVAGRRAVARMVDTLLPRDRFTVLAFDDSIETPPEFGKHGLVPGTDRHRFRAVEFLARVDARGGTEMARPLQEAVELLTRSGDDRDGVLVLITDGQVGNEDQILKSLGARLKRLRVFTLGIDTAVNAAFLKRLADLGGGACELVESEARLDEVMDQINQRIGQPVLTGLRLEPKGLQCDSATVTPARLPDVFAGVPVMILGRYHGEPEGGIVLHGLDAAGTPYSTTLYARTGGSQTLTSVWARGHVRDLEDRYVMAADRELEQQIVQTSLRFGVLSRFTAFVAVDRIEVVNPEGKTQQVTQAVELPADWDEPEAPQAPPLAAGLVCYSYAAPREADFLEEALPALPFDEPPPMNPMERREISIRRRASIRSRSGLLSRLLSFFQGRGKGKKAVREQALELLQRMQSAGNDTTTRRQTLLALAAEAVQLLLDAVKVRLNSSEKDHLDAVRGRLQVLDASADDAAVELLWKDLQETLCALAGVATPPAAAPDEEFWK